MRRVGVETALASEMGSRNGLKVEGRHGVRNGGARFDTWSWGRAAAAGQCDVMRTEVTSARASLRGR